MGEACSAYGRREGKRPLGRPRRRWENINMGLQELEYEDMTGSSWLRLGTGGRHL